MSINLQGITHSRSRCHVTTHHNPSIRGGLLCGDEARELLGPPVDALQMLVDHGLVGLEERVLGDQLIVGDVVLAVVFGLEGRLQLQHLVLQPLHFFEERLQLLVRCQRCLALLELLQQTRVSQLDLLVAFANLWSNK